MAEQPALSRSLFSLTRAAEKVDHSFIFLPLPCSVRPPHPPLALRPPEQRGSKGFAAANSATGLGSASTAPCLQGVRQPL